MEKEPRKASEVLLELEKKLDIALNIIRAQDLNIKILSNKFNAVLEALEKQSSAPPPPAPLLPKFMAEAVNTSRQQMQVYQFQQLGQIDSERQVPVSSEDVLPLDTSPQGFRRTSRPETFEEDTSYLKPQKPQQPPTPTPVAQAKRQNAAPSGRTVGETVVSNTTTRINNVEPTQQPRQSQQQGVVQNAIPVMQRVVNGQGKSLFLADVDIVDLASMQMIYKTRTNGTGKWMASLGIGNYRITVNKYDPVAQERLEVSQEIMIDGSESKIDLPALIIKSSK